MNKVILTIFVLISFSCKAQQFDNINQNDLTLNGINFLIDSKTNHTSSIINAFGYPDSIEDYFFEMDSIIGKKYYYKNGLVLYISNNSLFSFEITGNVYSFSSKNIKIGDNISSMEAKYPTSYLNRNNSTILLTYGICDCNFQIEYDSNNIITKIWLYVY